MLAERRHSSHDTFDQIMRSSSMMWLISKVWITDWNIFISAHLKSNPITEIGNNCCSRIHIIDVNDVIATIKSWIMCSGAIIMKSFNMFIMLFDTLTHWSLIKMVDFLQTVLKRKHLHFYKKKSIKFVSDSPKDNKSPLVPVMVWCCTSDKPLPEPMVTQFIATYMHHQDTMS